MSELRKITETLELQRREISELKAAREQQQQQASEDVCPFFLLSSS